MPNLVESAKQVRFKNVNTGNLVTVIPVGISAQGNLTQGKAGRLRQGALTEGEGW
jgi:hypothetical protein